MLKTRDEYIQRLRQMKTKVFLFGKETKNWVDDPIIRPSINSMSLTYELAQSEQYRDLFTTKSHLNGEIINRFTHIQQNVDDLVKKVKMLRVMGQHTGTCFQRCAGLDALNSLSAATYEIDKESGTDYHSRFKSFLLRVQTDDLICSAAMTDPKGDRSKSPSQQADAYLRIVKEDSNGGIVVRGAKVHITGAINSNETIVVPTRAMQAGDRDFAVAFAIPTDTDGMSFLYGRQPSDTRKQNCSIDVGNKEFGSQEAIIVFDDVYVPKERIFLKGEYQFCRRIVELFAAFHRTSYGGCKSGVADVLTGAAALIAKAQGTDSASSIKDKLVEMAILTETMYGAGIAASAEGGQLPSGAYWVNPLLANVCKLHVTRNPFEMARLAQDIAGGIVGTMPSEYELEDPVLGKIMKQYLACANCMEVEDRFRLVRLIENLTMGPGAVPFLTESLHGAGSPQAQRIMVERETNWEAKKSYAKKIAGIS